MVTKSMKRHKTRSFRTEEEAYRFLARRRRAREGAGYTRSGHKRKGRMIKIIYLRGAGKKSRK